ncbi:uncharacterized protein YggT (Ycf19 family) [Scopulibacillus daqui]|uniref:Uncharacterized protein YggT (Ycf19 family) n=1 Tax=Scopulibacillus daqui TaxID=1469162 RepID=A0ABS2PV82_9BACL|nr:uncharacterized protein YggT (Ycf19 family) [Scopulibacillus daqui]
MMSVLLKWLKRIVVFAYFLTVICSLISLWTSNESYLPYERLILSVGYVLIPIFVFTVIYKFIEAYIKHFTKN